MSEDAATSGRRGGDNKSPLHVASGSATATAVITTTALAVTTMTKSLTRQDACQSGDTPVSTGPLMDLSALEEVLLSQATDDSEMDTETEERLLKDKDQASKEPDASKRRKTAQQAARSGYKSSVKFLRKMDAKDTGTWSDREKRLVKKHKKIVKAFEKRYGKVAPSEASTTGVSSTIAKKDEAKMSEPEKGKKRLTEITQAPSTSAANSSEKSKTAKEKEKGKKRLGKTIQAPSTSKVTQKLKDNSTGKAKPPTEPKTAKSEGRDMAKSNPKRIRSADDGTTENKNKKAKTGFTSSEELTLAVIDRSDPDGKLSKENWLKVEAKILEAMLAAGETADVENICKFDGAGWRKGVKIVGCNNRESYDFLITCIRNLGDLWPGARIETIPAAALPLRVLAHVWIPPPVLEVTSTLRLISLQNKSLNTSGWQVLSSKPGAKEEGQDLKLAIDHESAAILRAATGVVKFGLGRVKFTISSNEGSWKAKGGTD